MKNLTLLILFTILVCCKKKDLCPDTYSLGFFKMPEYIKEFIKYDDVDTLVFISEAQDTITFLKTLEENFKVEPALQRHVPCSEDDSAVVRLVYTQEVSRYHFTSDSGDVLRFEYFPLLTRAFYTLLDAYKEDIKDPQFYHKIHIILPDNDTDIYSVIATFEDPALEALFKMPLQGPFTVSNISYNNVFYLSEHNQKAIFYDDVNGMIGFTDKNGVRWIRKK